MRASLATASALALLLAPRLAYAQAPTATATPAPFDPYRRAGAEILLPVLNSQGPDEVCESWIDVQNVGADDCGVSLVTWGEPGFCPPHAAGPLKIECSGLIRPGASWTFSGAQIPAGSRNGQLLRFSELTVETVEDGIAICDPYSDYLCELLFFGLVCECDAFTPFYRAYRSGTARPGDDFYPIDMRSAAGTGALAATVTRRCPGASTPNRDVTATYNGLALNRLGSIDPIQGGYVVYAPDAHVVTGGDGAPGVAGGTTYLYVQNAALQCASVDVWFAPRGGCGRSRLCASALTIAPLETLHVDSADCGPPNGEGAMWVRSTQPVAVVAERVVTDTLRTYEGMPSTIAPAPARALPAPRPIGAALFAPYAVNGAGGVRTSIVVQNVRADAAVRVRVSAIDPNGKARATFDDWLCARGQVLVDVGALAAVPEGWRGTVRVRVVGGPAGVGAAALSGIVRLGGGGGERAYGLQVASDGPARGHGAERDWALDSGAGILALPSVGGGGPGSHAAIVVANGSAAPGFSDIAAYIYDANGLIDRRCLRLTDGASEAIDLAPLAPIGAAFRGSAIVSAGFWEHDWFDSRGYFVGNAVAIAAVAVEDVGEPWIDGRPATLRVIVGVPLRWLDVVAREPSSGVIPRDVEPYWYECFADPPAGPR